MDLRKLGEHWIELERAVIRDMDSNRTCRPLARVFESEINIVKPIRCLPAIARPTSNVNNASEDYLKKKKYESK
jgi:hypothetical protein